MHRIRLAKLASIVGLIVIASLWFPSTAFAQNVCPGQCEGGFCHNCTGCTCPQACQAGGPTGCRPWFGCICPTGISADPWGDYSQDFDEPASEVPLVQPLADSTSDGNASQEP
jgi:hypothetical protein